VVVDQLRRDKEELLNRVVSLQQQQEAAMADKQRLCKKVSVSIHKNSS
jgi:chaperonin cofactor prefoldin